MAVESMEIMAGEIDRVIADIFGACENYTITAPSARHSAFIGVEHFASDVAAKVAKSTGAKYERLFEKMKATRAGHHPMAEKFEPILVKGLKPTNVIIVDDLATSGVTIEIHVRILRANGFKVTAIVWIRGDNSSE